MIVFVCALSHIPCPIRPVPLIPLPFPLDGVLPDIAAFFPP